MTGALLCTCNGAPSASLPLPNDHLKAHAMAYCNLAVLSGQLSAIDYE